MMATDPSPRVAQLGRQVLRQVGAPVQGVTWSGVECLAGVLWAVHSCSQDG